MVIPLVECIPNFSEGRRPEVIDQIAVEIASVEGVKLLDRHSDIDHNRTVLTLLGAPKAMKQAAFLAIKKAAELIDMDKQEGEHPRIGATDVVPFVPIRGISMSECVQMAQELGREVAKSLGIPVYLYEAAAATPDRVNLEKIRRGQYEGLKEEIGKNPERKPDFGPEKLGKAGATVIGAREPLIAYNVYLNTDDVSIAKKISRTVRFSSGGLRYVKAMGVLVDGLAQVSMNLTNFRKTPIALVFETIKREAQRYGAAIHHSELVGLIPQEALIDTAVWYTSMDQFESDQILENKLQDSSSGAQNAGYPFLDDLASSDPTPGGGSAAAFTAAEAAALTAMVVRLTVGKKKYADVEQEMRNTLTEVEDLREKLTTMIEKDADAFKAVMQAYKLPKSSEEQKQKRIDAITGATLEAARVPLETGRLSLDSMRLAMVATEKGNANAITDAWSAVTLGYSAISAASANVRINLASLEDNRKSQAIRKDLSEIETQAKDIYKQTRENIKKRAGLDLL